MIEKERLKELIEQGATIWFYEDLSGIEIIDLKENGYKYEIGVVDADDREHLLKTSISKYGKSIDDWWWFSGLFETKEELDWYIEFGCIERTERLELPTWEELGKKKEHYINFTTKRWTKCWLAIDMPYKNDFGKILITYADTDNNYYIVYDKRLTKENYTLACRKAKELFLGEKK